MQGVRMKGISNIIDDGEYEENVKNNLNHLISGK